MGCLNAVVLVLCLVIVLVLVPVLMFDILLLWFGAAPVLARAFH